MSSSYETEAIEDAKALLIDKLAEIDDEYTAYGADLGTQMLEEDWANGTLTFDSQKAYLYIMNHSRASASTYECLSEIGTDINPFDEPEKFHLAMTEEIVRSLLAKCPLVESSWNEELVFDANTIDTLTRQLEAVSPNDVER